MKNELLVEVLNFLLSQYEGGSGQVAEQAAGLRKKVNEDAVDYAASFARFNKAVDELPRAADDSAAPAETGGEPGDHLADAPLANPLRAHAGKKRKGHA